MKYVLKTLGLLILLIIISCGGKEEKKESDEIQLGNYAKKEEVKKPEASSANVDMNDMSNKGIGPIKKIEIPDEIDPEMAAKGKAIFDSKCMACHKPDKKFIGPAPKGVLGRRSPEWVMNMMLNPEEMILKDPIAKQLLIEHNGSPMANQNLTEEDARQLLEYFRTLD
ncbi:mono/diheme cytochrome c family protein [Christiangramia gaetbulicola]|uniref:Mono/diheme cytochrome c family protein n=1 Tax=Christiangramia gaetbulicola TaxID=703340 RepID=A0A2T6AIH7_9FLAO|nr:cytochrome c [Christiangramia gaetbulicola]PTX43597.1 mono/diheme cytochrome c family protein [Christiangramia gaetbulicola]